MNYYEDRNGFFFIKAVVNRECETSNGISFPLGEYVLSNNEEEKRIWFCKEYKDLKKWAIHLKYCFFIEVKVKNYRIEEDGKYSTEDGVMRISEPGFLGDPEFFDYDFFKELKSRYIKTEIWEKILDKQKNIDDFIKIRDLCLKARIIPKNLGVESLEFEFLLIKRSEVSYNLGEEHLKKPVFLGLYLDYYLLSSEEKRFFCYELSIPEKLRSLIILQNKENITYNIIDEVISANVYGCGINYLKFIVRFLIGEKEENTYINKYIIQERKDFIKLLYEEKGIYYTDKQICDTYKCELETIQIEGEIEEGYLDCVYECSEFLKNKETLIKNLNNVYEEKESEKEIFKKFRNKFI